MDEIEIQGRNCFQGLGSSCASARLLNNDCALLVGRPDGEGE